MKNREMIEFIFDFSGLDFNSNDQMERDRLVELAESSYSREEAIFTIKADKVEAFLNRLRETLEKPA